MVITIDGPAGAGKSSVARSLAKRLGFRFLDTGAMYRAVAYAVNQECVDWEDDAALARLASKLDIYVSEERVLLNGVEVTSDIRKMAITSVIHYIADNPTIRSQLVELQRRVASKGNFVTEGRDQGTVAFPDAVCKIFLTAAPKERARRRMLDLRKRGEDLSFEEVLARQNDRDERDRNRNVGRLVAADDAFLVSSDNKAMEQVVDELEAIARERLAEPPAG